MSEADQERKERQEKEQMLIAAAMPFIIDEIPGLGEIQMAGMVLDYIDPYGYNHTLDRSGVDKFVAGMMGGTQKAMSALATYLQANGDTSALTDDQWKIIGKPIPASWPKQLAMYNGFTDDGKKYMIDVLGAMGTVADPRSQNMDTLGSCITSNNDQQMQQYCKNESYKNAYLKFWKENYDAFHKNAVDAASKSIGGLFGPVDEQKVVTEDNKIQGQKAKVAGLMAATGLIIIGLFIYVLFFSGSNISTSVTASPTK